MAVDVSIAGKPNWNASDYSVAEDSTPVDPSDSTGGVGQITITVPENADTKLFRNKALVLTDGAQGSTTGTIRGLNGDGDTGTLTADSRMALLNVTRTAKPFSGTLEAAFRYYLGLCGVRDNITVEAGISTRQVTFPGWKGIVWDKLKQMVSAQRVETSLVGKKIVLRPLRGRVALNHRNASESWSHDASNAAQSIEVYYYQSQRRESLAYPLGGWNPDVQAYQVDAGQTVEFDISLEPQDDEENTLGASLTSIDQPTCVASVTPTYSATSVYTVAGNDGLPIPPAQWTDGGGNVRVYVNDDTRSITVKIRGMKTAEYAPYTIGMSSGDNTYYSSLRLRGDGVFYDRKKISLPTGTSADIAPTEVGALVDSPFISTLDDAYRAGIWTLASYTSARRSISVTSTGINRRGELTDTQFLSMGEFNLDPDFKGLTMGQFNEAFAGLTMKEFSDLQFEKVRDDFAHQAFGNVAGARVFHDGAWYRIRTVTAITPESVAYSADADDTMGDFNYAYAGMKAKEFNELHEGKTMSDFNARAMVTPDAGFIYIPKPGLTNPTPGDGIFPSNLLFPG